jgi:ketosteroid isomerase-like protein
MSERLYADHVEIHALLGRYAHAVDRQDFDLARSCYHPDAFDDHGRFKGNRDQLIAFFHQLGGTLESTFHMLGLPYIELVGDKAWVVVSAFYRRRSRGTAEAVIQGLRYLDYLEKRDDRWGVARRTVVLDWEHAVSDAPSIPSSDDWARGAYGEADPATAFLREAIRARVACSPTSEVAP